MTRSTSRPHVAVVGPGELAAGEHSAAEEVGRLLAAGGAVLVCGGLGGAMEAACRGARSAGGTTVGILPGRERTEANPHVDIAVPTGLGEARNAIIVRSADALVAVAGGYGTLSEIALALREGKTVVGLRTWELVRDGRADPGVVAARSPAEAAELALAAARAWSGESGRS